MISLWLFNYWVLFNFSRFFFFFEVSHAGQADPEFLVFLSLLSEKWDWGTVYHASSDCLLVVVLGYGICPHCLVSQFSCLSVPLPLASMSFIDTRAILHALCALKFILVNFIFLQVMFSKELIHLKFFIFIYFIYFISLCVCSCVCHMCTCVYGGHRPMLNIL